MALSKSILFPFMKAEIPTGEVLHAELLAVDNGSYFHLIFSEPDVNAVYSEMLERMQNCVRGRYCMPSRLATQPGRDCIVEYPGRRGGIYVRGKILEALPDSKSVRCELVDDVIDVIVHRSQIYHTVPTIEDIPKFPSVKCKLADMDIFLDSPYLKLLHQEYMKSEWKPGSSQFTVKVVDRDDPIPSVKLTTATGMDLTDVLQQYIPTFQRLEYPQFGIPTPVKITHCDEKGHVWFQPWNGKDLYAAVKYRLHEFSHGYMTPKWDVLSQAASWKNHYFTGPGEVLIFKEGRKSYRVRKLAKNVDGSVEIFFVDHGYFKVVRDDTSLLPAQLVDPNLCFIPPQCLPVRFIGAACSHDDIKAFNLLKFWKYAQKQPVSIVLQKRVDGRDFLQKDRLVPSHCLDANHNFLPPQCVPVKCFGTVGLEVYYGNLRNFWLNARNKPVSSVFETYDIQLDGEKFYGGVIPPEADILVSIHPDVECSDQTGHSLYDIYHTLEACHVHGQKPKWDELVGEHSATPLSDQVNIEPAPKKVALDINANIIPENCEWDEENVECLDKSMKNMKLGLPDIVASPMLRCG